ncbi:MAG: DUF2997 domain-containing protein [bacterium]|nr:DUF2997 domain-containing protein [bacterium]
MAERHDLKIIITETGEVQLEVSGVDGPKCLKITEDLEDALGEVLVREKKSEFYKEETSTTIDTEIK